MKDLLLDQAVDIKDLGISKEVPEADHLPFDLVSTLRPYDLENIWGEHAKLLLGERHFFRRYFEHGSNMRIALGTPPMSVDKGMWEAAVEEISLKRGFINRVSWTTAVELAFKIKLASPDRYPELGFLGQDYEDIARKAQRQVEVNDPGGFLEIAGWLSVLSPDHLSKLLRKPQVSIYFAEVAGIRHLRGFERIMNQRKDTISYFCRDLAYFRLVYPDYFHLVRPSLELWRAFTDEALRTRRIGDTRTFLHFLSWMKVIAASEVKVTGDGLVLKMDSLPTPQEANLPNVRSYQ